MSDEFVGENGGVSLHLDKVNGHSRNFGEDCAAQGISESKIDVPKSEVYTVGCSLGNESQTRMRKR